MNHLITLEEHSNELIEHAAAKILKYTPQLFLYDKDAKRKLTAFGSSVLFKTKTAHYMATAQHCIQQNGSRIKVSVLSAGGVPIDLQDDTAFASDGKKEKIDIALMKLSANSVKYLSEEYLFFDFEDIWKAAVIGFETDFLVVGHPITKTSFNYARNSVKFKPLIHMAKSAKREEYQRLGYDNGSNTLIGYHRRKGTILGSRQMSMSPDPTGVSGCGFWRIKDYRIGSPQNVEIALAGIMYLHDSQNLYMVGGNSEVLYDLLKKSKERFGE